MLEIVEIKCGSARPGVPILGPGPLGFYPLAWEMMLRFHRLLKFTVMNVGDTPGSSQHLWLRHQR